MLALFRSAAVLFIVLSALTGLAYPLLVTAMAHLVFPYQASGSVVSRDARPIGSALIGQNFTSERYFWGRPSATSPMPYNAASSSGSNLAPTNPSLRAAVEGRVARLRQAHADQKQPTSTQPAASTVQTVPIDLVAASASGLDPHISPAGAYYQVGRVARARGLADDQVRSLIARHIEHRTLGLLGEPRVNVLQLNLELDALLSPARPNEQRATNESPRNWTQRGLYTCSPIGRHQ